jgi:predicted nucleic acid-binding protein
MTFQSIPAGAAVFLDANVLLYAIVPHPTYGLACEGLLDRIEQQQDIQGLTSADVLADVAHRLMTIEASDRFGWPTQGIANRLRRHPNEVQQLVLPRRGLDEILAARVSILPVTGPDVSRAVDLAQQFGLLTGDALIVALMQAHGISTLASLDADFDRVPGITRYALV